MATYRLDDERTVTALLHGDVDRAREEFNRDILPMVLQALGTEVLHAAGAELPRGVTAFCGDSGAGKSTLACAMGVRGRAVWADDALAFQGAQAVPIPFGVRLRPSAAARFPSPPVTVSTDHPPAPLAAIFLLRPAEALRVRPLPSAEAFRLLLGHGYCFSVQIPDLKRRMMQNYMSLVADVPVYELRFPIGLDRLDATCELVETTAAPLT